MSSAALQQEFLHLLSTQQRRLHSLCRFYYAGVEDRQDAFQEIVLQLWKSYPSFQGAAHASTWMYRVALNTIFSRVRREKAQPEWVRWTEQLQQLPNPEDLVDPAAAGHLLEEAIHQLSAEDKALVLLHLEGYSYPEIAALVEMSATNVSTRLHRIKGKLGKYLKLQLL
ncbi:RNA polymerase sigma factor [Hymenobacter cellulosilyticus]|uniref:RNA polymerase sigma factor n=1 Tax=Hymenobacter cellulosilyticus TaxID=2932248 RepID=A0A8T9Q1Z3_9BACT|nr:RNA polymerase sigma factor [Hymenobacter cellulosilyticus]UOQ71524.1 RNA polymerase sigma factor [Hymenobacter cellulosilyticus]